MNLYKFIFKSYIFIRRIISLLVIFSITINYLGPSSYKFREDVNSYLTDEEYLLFEDVLHNTFKNPKSNIDLVSILQQKEKNKLEILNSIKDERIKGYTFSWFISHRYFQIIFILPFLWILSKYIVFLTFFKMKTFINNAGYSSNVLCLLLPIDFRWKKYRKFLDELDPILDKPSLKRFEHEKFNVKLFESNNILIVTLVSYFKACFWCVINTPIFYLFIAITHCIYLFNGYEISLFSWYLLCFYPFLVLNIIFEFLYLKKK
jgi:hypothetical protein